MKHYLLSKSREDKVLWLVITLILIFQVMIKSYEYNAEMKEEKNAIKENVKGELTRVVSNNRAILENIKNEIYEGGVSKTKEKKEILNKYDAFLKSEMGYTGEIFFLKRDLEFIKLNQLGEERVSIKDSSKYLINREIKFTYNKNSHDIQQCKSLSVSKEKDKTEFICLRLNLNHIIKKIEENYKAHNKEANIKINGKIKGEDKLKIEEEIIPIKIFIDKKVEVQKYLIWGLEPMLAIFLYLYLYQVNRKKVIKKEFEIIGITNKYEMILNFYNTLKMNEAIKILKKSHVDEVIKYFYNEASSKKVDIKCKYKSQSDDAKINVYLLQQILISLILESLYETPRGGLINIDITIKINSIDLHYHDSSYTLGDGINEAKIDNKFLYSNRKEMSQLLKKEGWKIHEKIEKYKQKNIILKIPLKKEQPSNIIDISNYLKKDG